jgi:DNA-3-methyladenine glycosylase II
LARIDPWRDAVVHLHHVDDRWAERIERIGPCMLRPRTDRFGILVRSILSQQISGKAAEAIERRLRDVVGFPYVPVRLLAAAEPNLRSAGLSAQKIAYLMSLSETVESGCLPLSRIGRFSDEAIIDRLTRVKGIGRWTAEMFLIFALNRPDVLPVGDLGIRAGIRAHFNLADVPTPRECVPLAEPWRPYRSVAMWYLWKDSDLRKPTKS